MATSALFLNSMQIWRTRFNFQFLTSLLNMATSAAVLNFTSEYGTSFKFFACLRLHYCIFVIHKNLVEQDSKLKDSRIES